MEETWIIEGKYEVISRIKQGGFGIVYYGFDRNFEKPIAIKAIEPGLLQEAKYIDMFLEEAKNAAKLNHNNIVHVYDLIKASDGQFYIIMEYIDGVDLRRVLKKCISKGISIPPELSIYIIKEVCKALEYAHNKRDLISNEPLNLVHQDISPSNIMISINGNVKLIDFGIAKIKFHHNGDPQKIVLTGKLPYMAPEQLNGTSIDKRSDLFSLGTVFYEVLTNKRLFHSDNDEKVIEAIRKGRIDQKLFSQHDVPASVQNVIIKSLQRDSDNRYQGANEIYIDLVEYLMTSTQSVELSVELGEFIGELFSDELADKDESEQGSEFTVKDSFEAKDDIVENSKSLEEEWSAIKSHSVETSIEYGEKESQLQETPPTKITSQREDDIFNREPSSQKNMDISPGQPLENKVVDLQFPKEEVSVNKTNMPPEENEIPEVELKDDNIVFEEDTTSWGLDKITQARKEGIITDDKISYDEKKMSRFTPSAFSSLEEDEEGEDDVKTVIDVIRLSAKTHKRKLLLGSIGAVVGFIIFMILNISFRWTASGEKIYDYLFPPAIKILTAPQGAKVYIDNKLMPGKTPLSVPKITPGVHKLSLSYPGFPTVTRSLQVPSKGAIKVDGEKSRAGYEPYMFRFKALIELSSDPIGATITINNIKYKQLTPTGLEWEVGIPLNIEMSKPGFQALAGFSLNTIGGTPEIEDNRLWNFDIIEEENKKYVIEGLFKKFINVSSVPSGVTFYLDGSPTPTGKTGAAQVIALSVGRHEILFTKAGFNSKRVKITVDENGPKSIFASLTRNVRFFAKDVTDPNDNELGATIVRIYRQGRSYSRNDNTPCEIALPPVKHKVLIKKEGYKDAVVLVSRTTKVVVARMNSENMSFNVTVVDALTGLPIKAAQVSYIGLNGETDSEVYFGATDDYGKCSNKLNPGQYTFKAKKFGYFEKSSNINTVTEGNKLKFKLIIQ